MLCFRDAATAATSLAVMVTVLSSAVSSSASDPPLLRFDLQPTSALVVEQQQRRQRQRRRRQQQQEDSGKLLLEDDEDMAVSYPDAWFHPYSRGVYAATATTTTTTTTNNSSRRTGETELDTENENANDSNNDYHYTDFVTYRHLSRYEHEFRTTFELQLYPNWDGRYVPSKNKNNNTNNTPTTTGRVPFIFHDYTNDTVLMEHLLRRRTTQKKKERNEDETETTTVLHPNATTTTTTTTEKKKSHDRRSVRFPSRWTPYSRRSLEHYQQQQQQQHQGVPLVQGYGTHYVHIWVGTPIPQRQSVIVVRTTWRDWSFFFSCCGVSGSQLKQFTHLLDLLDSACMYSISFSLALFRSFVGSYVSTRIPDRITPGSRVRDVTIAVNGIIPIRIMIQPSHSPSIPYSVRTNVSVVVIRVQRNHSHR